MTTETKWLGGILIATVALLAGGIFLLSKGSSDSSQSVAGTAVVQIDYSKGQKIGSDSAKVKLVEFSDFQCPACASAYPFVKKLKADYPDQIQIIYRHFPLSQHANAKTAANFAEAAGQQNKFWEMHDKIFETQTQWSDLTENDANTFFLDLVKQLGLNEDQVKSALGQNSFKTKIDEDIAESKILGVNSTPTFFLNGKKLNLKSFADLDTAVATELK